MSLKTSFEKKKTENRKFGYGTETLKASLRKSADKKSDDIKLFP